MENLRKKFVDRFTTNSTGTGAVPSSNNLQSNNDDTISNHSGSYNESTLRQFWMPDQVVNDCYDCASKFTTFKRKHHWSSSRHVFTNFPNTNLRFFSTKYYVIFVYIFSNDQN